MCHSIEVLNHVWVKPLHDAHINPGHLIPTIRKIANSIDKLLRQLLMSFECIIDCVNSILLALKPLVDKLYQLNVSIKVLSYAAECFHAGLGNL